MQFDRLVLVRHATPVVGVADPGLSDLGRRQAAGLGALLTELGITPTSIVVSPRRRTRETAELLSGGLAASPPLELLDSACEGFDAACLGDIGGRRGTVVIVTHEDIVGAVVRDLAPESYRGGYARASVTVVENAQAASHGPPAI